MHYWINTLGIMWYTVRALRSLESGETVQTLRKIQGRITKAFKRPVIFIILIGLYYQKGITKPTRCWTEILSNVHRISMSSSSSGLPRKSVMSPCATETSIVFNIYVVIMMWYGLAFTHRLSLA